MKTKGSEQSATASNVVAIIPARLASSRFPGKVLHELLGRPMCWWTYKAAVECRAIDEVWIATGDQEIITACRSLGMNFIQTTRAHNSGTDRVAEAAQTLNASYVINLQADEPTIDCEALESLAETIRIGSVPMATLIGPTATEGQRADVNCVKAFIDSSGVARDFCRGPLERLNELEARIGPCHSHIGVYAFRRDALLHFTLLDECKREQVENLEQLRALSAGWAIQTAQTGWSPVGVDTFADAVLAEMQLRRGT